MSSSDEEIQNAKKKFKQAPEKRKRDPSKVYVTLCVPVEIRSPRKCIKVIAEMEDSDHEDGVDFWDDEYGTEIQEAINEKYGKDKYVIDDVVERYGPSTDADFEKYPIAICKRSE